MLHTKNNLFMKNRERTQHKLSCVEPQWLLTEKSGSPKTKFLSFDKKRKKISITTHPSNEKKFEKYSSQNNYRQNHMKFKKTQIDLKFTSILRGEKCKGEKKKEIKQRKLHENPFQYFPQTLSNLKVISPSPLPNISHNLPSGKKYQDLSLKQLLQSTELSNNLEKTFYKFKLKKKNPQNRVKTEGWVEEESLQ